MSGLTSWQILWVLGWFCESTFVHQRFLVPVSPCVNTVQGWSWLPHVHAVLKLVSSWHWACKGARHRGTQSCVGSGVSRFDRMEEKKVTKKGEEGGTGTIMSCKEGCHGETANWPPSTVSVISTECFWLLKCSVLVSCYVISLRDFFEFILVVINKIFGVFYTSVLLKWTVEYCSTISLFLV